MKRRLELAVIALALQVLRLRFVLFRLKGWWALKAYLRLMAAAHDLYARRETLRAGAAP